MKIVWYCDICNWVTTSDSKQHHCMDYCKCEKTYSAVDLEEYGCRFLGNPIQLAVYDKGKWTRKHK